MRTYPRAQGARQDGALPGRWFTPRSQDGQAPVSGIIHLGTRCCRAAVGRARQGLKEDAQLLLVGVSTHRRDLAREHGTREGSGCRRSPSRRGGARHIAEQPGVEHPADDDDRLRTLGKKLPEFLPGGARNAQLREDLLRVQQASRAATTILAPRSGESRVLPPRGRAFYPLQGYIHQILGAATQPPSRVSSAAQPQLPAETFAYACGAASEPSRGAGQSRRQRSARAPRSEPSSAQLR